MEQSGEKSDAQPVHSTTVAGPQKSWAEVRAEEEERVDQRRLWFERNMPPTDAETAPPDHRIGIALSGGGIRSATFSAGVLHSLSHLQLAHKIDYLSTVSGGGYAGAFYCSLFVPSILRGATPNLQRPGIEPLVSEHTSNLGRAPLESDQGLASLGRLREGGHYLMPAGTTDTIYAAVIALRNWIAVAMISGIGILAIFLLIGLLRVPDTLCALRDAHQTAHLVTAQATCAAPRVAMQVDRGDADGAGTISALESSRRAALASQRTAGPPPLLGTSYLWILALLLIPLWLQPTSWAYWMTRGSPFPRTPLQYLLNWAAIVALAAAAAIAYLLLGDAELRASAIALPLGGATVVGAVLGLIYYLFARIRVGSDDRRAKKKKRLIELVDANRVAKESRIRTKLSRWLYRGFVVFCCVAGLALVDDLARDLYLWSLSRYEGRFWAGFEMPGWISVLIALLVPVTRWLLTQGQAATLFSWPRLGPLLRRFGRSIALVVGLFLLLSLMVFWAAIAYEIIWHDWPVAVSAHFVSWYGLAPDRPWLPPLALTFFVGACAFALGHVRSFLNQSSLASFYIGRLRKAYLGATNVERTHEHECHTDLEHPLDDIALEAYYHSAILAPVHLVNVTVNETTAASSRLIQRDRKGKSMTISPAGYVTTLTKPTDDPVGFPLHGVGEQLPLSAWIGISGAAVSTGVGRNTTLGQSLLAALVNMRLGYWWDSPVPPANSRDRLFGDLVQRYLMREARAEYEGTHTNRWYLSDGGHYENTGIYELVRRRVRLIVGCDNGADPDYVFPDLINLIRKLRIDFDAETFFVGKTELNTLLGQDNALRAAFGELEEIGKEAPSASPHLAGPYAALARIRYRAKRDKHTPPTTLILIKPRVGGGELPDLVRYKASNAAFPQQPTADQFFDEAQWESYFRLGQLIADTIFEPKRPTALGIDPLPKHPPTWWPSELAPLP